MDDMDKIPCPQCGALILPTTAAKNEGLCMPCRHGYRANLEASKDYYRKQREREGKDPMQALWHGLLDRVHGTTAGYSGLTVPECLYLAVGLLDGEVHNGGFDQYFHNSAGDHYADAVAGLEAMEARASLELLLKAKQILFGFRDVPTSTGLRRRVDVSDSQHQRLAPLDRAFRADPDGLVERVQAFVESHGLLSAEAMEAYRALYADT